MIEGFLYSSTSIAIGSDDFDMPLESITLADTVCPPDVESTSDVIDDPLYVFPSTVVAYSEIVALYFPVAVIVALIFDLP